MTGIIADTAAAAWFEGIPCPLLLVALDDGRLVYANRCARERLPGAPALRPDPAALARGLAQLAAQGAAAAVVELPTAAGAPLSAALGAQVVEVDGQRCAVLAVAGTDLPPAADGRHDPLPWRAVFDKAGVGIALLDLDGRFLEVNQRWRELFGLGPKELGALTPAELVADADPSRPDDAPLGALLRGEIDQCRSERCYQRRDGVAFWGDLSLSLLRDAAGAPAAVVGFLLDITPRKQAEQRLNEINARLEAQLLENHKLQAQLSDLALRDPLTGLFNRRYLEETLPRELARSLREGAPLSLVMMDIDHFKRLNDRHGHQAGDQVMKELARVLLKFMRSEDIACRFGGDEFVAILPGAPLRVAVQRAEEWRAAFRSLKVPCHGAELRCALSMGVAEFPRHGTRGDQLLSCADQALYRAKRSGRDRVVVGS